MYNENTTRLKTVWNWSLLLHRVLICFEEATNQARSFHAAKETITRITHQLLYHRYSVYRDWKMRAPLHTMERLYDSKYIANG